MESIEKSEISEETRYVWECPKCNHFNEMCEDPDYMELIMCEGCYTDFEVKE